MARLSREALVNSSWEDFGHVMCLDVLRAIERSFEGFGRLFGWLIDAAVPDPILLLAAENLREQFRATARNTGAPTRAATDAGAAMQLDAAVRTDRHCRCFHC